MSDPTRLVVTRRALHAVAEQVLAAAEHKATGRIGLRPTPGGFGTPWFTDGGSERQVRIEGTDLVVADEGGARRTPLRAVGDAAAFVGIEPGAPADVYPPATTFEPDARLDLDPGAATTIHDWFHLTGAALEKLRQQYAARAPSIAQLWPEHFDLAVTLDAVTYGGSPGDDQHGQPYLYVGPQHPDGHTGDFWNEPFGASLPYGDVRSVDDALAYFRTGRSLTATD
jgi:hypothetical protein